VDDHEIENQLHHGRSDDHEIENQLNHGRVDNHETENHKTDDFWLTDQNLNHIRPKKGTKIGKTPFSVRLSKSQLNSTMVV
jgi:hypothetical protein